MSWFSKFLRSIGVLSDFTHDDILNAEAEDALLEHSKVVREMETTTRVRKTVNDKLRRVLAEARERSSSFGDFEQNIRRETRRHVRRPN